MMLRSVPSLVITALLLAAGCGKDSPPRSEPAPAKATAPDKATVDKPADKPAADKPAPEPAEQVRKTGVLDLEIATTGKRHAVRNATFEVTFPSRPAVQSQRDKHPKGGIVTSAIAVATHGSEQLAFAVTPMPKGEPYDVETGIAGARDGAIRNVGAKLEREVETTIGGLPGKKVTASVKQGSQKMYLEMHIVWDAPHHQLIYTITASPDATPSQAARDFVASLMIKSDAAAADPSAAPPT